MVKKNIWPKNLESQRASTLVRWTRQAKAYFSRVVLEEREARSRTPCRIARHFCRIVRHSSQFRRSTIKSNHPVSLVLPYSSCANFGLQRCTERYCERIPASASARLESVMTVYFLMLDVRMVEEIHENRLSLKVCQKCLDHEELFPSFYVSWNYRWLWSLFPERNQ